MLFPAKEHYFFCGENSTCSIFKVVFKIFSFSIYLTSYVVVGLWCVTILTSFDQTYGYYLFSLYLSEPHWVIWPVSIKLFAYVAISCLNFSSLLLSLLFHSVTGMIEIVVLEQVYQGFLWRSLRKKCLYSELFWSIFSRVRTELIRRFAL